MTKDIPLFSSGSKSRAHPPLPLHSHALRHGPQRQLGLDLTMAQGAGLVIHSRLLLSTPRLQLHLSPYCSSCSTSLPLSSDHHTRAHHGGFCCRMAMWLGVRPWVTSSIGAVWHSTKQVSMSYLCCARGGRSMGGMVAQRSLSVCFPPPALHCLDLI